jgi:hypothetical protein
VEDLTVSVQNRNDVVLAWNTNSYSGDTIEDFKVLRDGALIAITSVLTYTDLALEDGEYTFSIIANYSNGMAEAVTSETIQIEYPYPVSELASTVSEDSVSLTWDYLETGSPIFKIFRNNVFISQTSELNYNDTN